MHDDPKPDSAKLSPLAQAYAELIARRADLDLARDQALQFVATTLPPFLADQLKASITMLTEYAHARDRYDGAVLDAIEQLRAKVTQ